MTEHIDISVVQNTLAKLIASLGKNDEIIVTQDGHPIGRLLPIPYGVPVAGRCKGMLTIIAEDEEHLEDFKEYMP